MRNLYYLLSFVILLTFSFLCINAGRDKFSGYGDDFKVELINCDGTVARTWISSGKVLSESSSDWYYFKDSKSGNLIEVTGTLVITRITNKNKKDY